MVHIEWEKTSLGKVGSYYFLTIRLCKNVGPVFQKKLEILIYVKNLHILNVDG